jgi:hypothetical protein
MLTHLLGAVLRNKLPIWPVLGDKQLHFLSEVLVAEDYEDVSTLQALANAGAVISKPPGYIVKLLQQSKYGHMMLTPQSARHQLLVSTENLSAGTGRG